MVQKQLKSLDTLPQAPTHEPVLPPPPPPPPPDWQSSGQVAAVSLASHLPSPQTGQLAPGVFWQTPATHLSVVQAWPSSHSAAMAQHLPLLVCEHLPAMQESVVQAEPSSHSASELQQPAPPAACEHLPALHLSVVQGLPSLHSASILQHSDGSAL